MPWFRFWPGWWGPPPPGAGTVTPAPVVVRYVVVAPTVTSAGGVSPAASTARPSPVAARYAVAVPTVLQQVRGLFIRTASGTQELALVAEADAASGMGGVVKIVQHGTRYAVALVSTTDVNATALRIQTTTGVKAVRRKT